MTALKSGTPWGPIRLAFPDMALHAVIAFAAVAALLVVAPGPDWAFVLRTVSRRESLAAAVLGLVAGYVAMTATVATGLGLLVIGAPAVLNLLTVLGGSYLVWLGWWTWRSARAAPTETVQPTSRQRSTFVNGVCVSGLNPKVLLVFVALLPQFVRPGAAWPVDLQLAVLGLTFTALVGRVLPSPRDLGRIFRPQVGPAAPTAGPSRRNDDDRVGRRPARGALVRLIPDAREPSVASTTVKSVRISSVRTHQLGQPNPAFIRARRPSSTLRTPYVSRVVWTLAWPSRRATTAWSVPLRIRSVA